MWKLHVQFLTFPSHDLPQSEPRRGKQVALGVITAQNCGICRCQDKFLSTACTGAGSVTLHLTTSETSLCSCRVQADPEPWWRNSKKCDSSEKSEDLAGGTPLSVPGAKRKKKDHFCCCCLAQLLAQQRARNTSSAQGRHWGRVPCCTLRPLCQHLLCSLPMGLSPLSCHHQMVALPMSPPLPSP